MNKKITTGTISLTSPTTEEDLKMLYEKQLFSFGAHQKLFFYF